MIGYQVPKSLKQAKEFDRLAENHKWEKSNELKHEQLQDYKTFIDQGKFNKSRTPKPCVMVFEIFFMAATFKINSQGSSKQQILIATMKN